MNGFGIDKFLKLTEKRGKEREEHGNRKAVLVKEVFMPMSAVFRVRDLGVNPHDRREQLSDSEDHQSGDELGIQSSAGGRVDFALHVINQRLAMVKAS